MYAKQVVACKGSRLQELEQQGIHRKQEVRRMATTSPKAEKRIPLAWNEIREISFWQEPECD